MSAWRPWCALGVLLFGLAACDKQGAGTDTPGDDPGSRMEGREGDVSTAAPGVDGKTGQPGTALPTVRDRDPEEEKRKMARSRAQSAKAEEALAGGRLEPAILAAREALRMHEQNVHAMLVIAEAYFRQGKYEIVQAVITSGLAVDPKIRTPAETSRLYNLQGFALMGLGKDSLATQSFKKAAENDEKNAAAWNNLGTRYLEAGDVKTARSCFEYAVDLDARFYKAHLNLGAAQRAEGQWKEAEASFLTALKLRPSYAQAYFDLGILYLDADPFPGLEGKQRLEKSISYLTKYRELAGGAASSRPTVSTKGATSAAKIDPPAATREIADDYIRVAKKGLERIQRDAERGKAAPANGGDAAAASAGNPAPQTPGAATPTPVTPTSAGGKDPGPAAPQKPGTGTTPAAPQKPGTTPAAPQKPGTTPAAPQKPGTTPAPTSPSTPAPKPPAPTPAPQKPPSSPPPSSPPPSAPAKPTPTPVAPQKPTPQPVKPTPVAPQKPGHAARHRDLAPRVPALASPRSTLDRLARRDTDHDTRRDITRDDPTDRPQKRLAARGTRGVDSTLTTAPRANDRVTRRAALARHRLCPVPKISLPAAFVAFTGHGDDVS